MFFFKIFLAYLFMSFLGNQKATVCCLCDISILFRFDCFFIYVALSLLLKIFLFFFFYFSCVFWEAKQLLLYVFFVISLSCLDLIVFSYALFLVFFFFSRFSSFFSWVLSANKQLLLYIFSAISLFYLDLIVVFACLQEKNMLGIADYSAS